MGELNVNLAIEPAQRQQFTKQILRDVKALEYMLDNEWFENDVDRIGAEQEVCLLDKSSLKPANTAMEIMAKTKIEELTTELAKFNLELNLTPLLFEKDCLSKMEEEIQGLLLKLEKEADKEETRILLAGISPTIRKYDLGIQNLTPLDRYKALVDAINILRGKHMELKIHGIDELNLTHDSPLLEACNTGFQVHLQVSQQNFVKMYNIAQAVAAPVMAVGANSPMLFGKRLWHETRLALFQQSIDTRISGDHLREESPRVMFGNGWLKKSIMEIYKEDIARFKVILSTDPEKDPFEVMKAGGIPALKSLQVHNSTVYRWNRPCYGNAGTKPHLRIENRILPSGPTVLDEMANAAFWLGLMKGMDLKYDDITKVMDFDDVKANFLAAGRTGMDNKFIWENGERIPCAQLILEELIPIAKKGLESVNVDKKDIKRYLDVIAGRAKTGINGASWTLKSYSQLIKTTSKEEALSSIANAMIENQKTEKPVHLWELASKVGIPKFKPESLVVEEFMQTDLFTVEKDDIIELVTDLINWNKLRYVPVEDSKGNLVGLVTSRTILTYLRKQPFDKKMPKIVEELMIKNPITIKPHSTIKEALEIMENEKIGCLPVVNEGKLVGVLTESNFLSITSRLVRRLSAEKK